MTFSLYIVARLGRRHRVGGATALRSSSYTYEPIKRLYFFFQFIELIHVSIEGVSMGACAVQQLQTRAELQENAAFKFSFWP